MSDDHTSRFGPLLGRGRRAEVFAHEGHALKLYGAEVGPAEPLREAANLGVALEAGLPVPQLFSVGQHDGRWGLAIERIPGATLGEACLSGAVSIDAVVDAWADMHARVHAVAAASLPSQKARFARGINRASGLDDDARADLLERLADMPDGVQLCHGDFHPHNLAGDPDALVILDWLDASCGDPAGDVCRSHIIVGSQMPELAGAYLARYCASGMAEARVRAWRPFVAAARLSEGVSPDETRQLLAIVGETGQTGRS